MTWLNNAYAMETDIVKTLESQIDDFDDFPDVQGMVRQHLEESKGHAEKVKACIERRGGDVSDIKSGMANIMATLKGASMEMMHDKAIKNTLVNYATEHFEIASYKSLIETAREVGDTESIPVFEGIIAEEEDMARMIDSEMPNTIREFLKNHNEQS